MRQGAFGRHSAESPGGCEPVAPRAFAEVFRASSNGDPRRNRPLFRFSSSVAVGLAFDDERAFARQRPAVTTIVCGHTHMPFTRLAAGRLVVNPGSVGMPYGRAGAHWALLGPGVELRRTLLDVEAAAARIAAGSTFEQAAAWADYCLNARCTEEDAFAIFVPHEGRDEPA